MNMVERLKVIDRLVLFGLPPLVLDRGMPPRYGYYWEKESYGVDKLYY